MDEEAFVAFLKEASLVGYSPLSDEPPYDSFLKKHSLPEPVFVIPPLRDADPAVLAKKLADGYGGGRVAVLIPGRRFDMTGTRHGKGGGWYDRFLELAPREWLRVGVLYEAQLSKTTIKRERWDQEMHMFLVQADSGWKVIEPQTW